MMPKNKPRKRKLGQARHKVKANEGFQTLSTHILNWLVITIILYEQAFQVGDSNEGIADVP